MFLFSIIERDIFQHVIIHNNMSNNRSLKNMESGKRLSLNIQETSIDLIHHRIRTLIHEGIMALIHRIKALIPQSIITLLWEPTVSIRPRAGGKEAKGSGSQESSKSFTSNPAGTIQQKHEQQSLLGPQHFNPGLSITPNYHPAAVTRGRGNLLVIDSSLKVQQHSYG